MKNHMKTIPAPADGNLNEIRHINYLARSKQIGLYIELTFRELLYLNKKNMKVLYLFAISVVGPFNATTIILILIDFY